MKLDLNFQYILDYDYDGHYNCAARGCNEEGICRCYTIDSAKVKDIDFDSVKEHILEKIRKTTDKATRREIAINSVLDDTGDLSEYYLDRLLRIYRAWDVESWEVSWSHDWYGDEVDRINLSSEQSLLKDIDYMFDSTKELILYLLEKEYGSINDRILGKNFKIDFVPMDRVVFPQKEHYKSIGELSYYNDENYQLPRGIVIEDNGYYRVIDGYHRLKNTKMAEPLVIVAY